MTLYLHGNRLLGEFLFFFLAGLNSRTEVFEEYLARCEEWIIFFSFSEDLTEDFISLI